MFKAFSSCESFQRSIFGKPLRQNQAVEEVPRLIFPKCSGKMKVISVIEDDEVIKNDTQASGFMGD